MSALVSIRLECDYCSSRCQAPEGCYAVEVRWCERCEMPLSECEHNEEVDEDEGE